MTHKSWFGAPIAVRLWASLRVKLNVWVVAENRPLANTVYKSVATEKHPNNSLGY